ncbi:MAG: ribonuclease III [Firmicutes bacterium]|nr:ribonuclease III [Bacillota bacterium]
MENYLNPKMSAAQVDAISSLGLAHVGDGVYELLCRSYLAEHGDHTLKNLHSHTISLVNAPAQARFAARLLPQLSERELAYYRRGRNAHTHAAPKSATAREYSMATGLEALFGALYLLGETARLNELFIRMMEEDDGI